MFGLFPTEPVLSSAQKSSSDLRVYETISSSWDLRQAVVDLRKLMLEAQSGTVSELQDLSNKVFTAEVLCNSTLSLHNNSHPSEGILQLYVIVAQ